MYLFVDGAESPSRHHFARAAVHYNLKLASPSSPCDSSNRHLGGLLVFVGLCELSRSSLRFRIMDSLQLTFSMKETCHSTPRPPGTTRAIQKASPKALSPSLLHGTHPQRPRPCRPAPRDTSSVQSHRLTRPLSSATSRVNNAQQRGLQLHRPAEAYFADEGGHTSGD